MTFSTQHLSKKLLDHCNFDTKSLILTFQAYYSYFVSTLTLACYYSQCFILLLLLFFILAYTHESLLSSHHLAISEY